MRENEQASKRRKGSKAWRGNALKNEESMCVCRGQKEGRLYLGGVL